jgi:hypothetical protein
MRQFLSPRKSLDQKNKYYSASGKKNDLENLPFLPRVVHDVSQATAFQVKV